MASRSLARLFHPKNISHATKTPLRFSTSCSSYRAPHSKDLENSEQGYGSGKGPSEMAAEHEEDKKKKTCQHTNIPPSNYYFWSIHEGDYSSSEGMTPDDTQVTKHGELESGQVQPGEEIEQSVDNKASGQDGNVGETGSGWDGNAFGDGAGWGGDFGGFGGGDGGV